MVDGDDGDDDQVPVENLNMNVLNSYEDVTLIDVSMSSCRRL